MVKTVHVIPHSHWDREWYFTTSRSKVYLMKDLEEVIKNLESNVGYDRFILDGQASLIEDYLRWRPQDFMRIKQLVQDKKLIIGPWYTQTDQFVISGESIVRNLQYGIDICRTIGPYMNVGYVPDSFGQESSMPQIYKGFGIESTMFWRGVSEEQVEHTEYKWVGEDGTEINVYQIPYGYYIGGIVDETRLDKIMAEAPFADIVRRATTNNIAFPNGFDQAPARKNLPQLIDKLNAANPNFNFKISSIEEYIKAVKDVNPEFKQISGELTNGKNMRVHKSIYSSRSDLKKLNTQIQNYLVNVLEPILTMADHYGIEYPKGTMDDVWKLMFENAAHDSIGSCVSDTTNEDIYMRYKQVRDISTNLVEVSLRQIAIRIKENTKYKIALTVFNTLPINRTKITKAVLYTPTKNFSIVDKNGKQIVFSIESCEDQTDYILNQTIQLNPGKQIYRPNNVYKAVVYLQATDIPAIGYKQLYLDYTVAGNRPLILDKSKQIENEFFKVSINDNGTLDIFDKDYQKEYINQALIVENGDGGDSFNYSPAKNDMVIRSSNQPFTFNIKKSDIMSVITIHYDFSVPKDLTERSKQQVSTKMPIDLQIILEKNTKIIKFTVKIDNREPLDHRVCVDFDSDIKSKVSIADQQFGTISRPTYREKEMKQWAKNKANWNEMPITIETCQSFVGLSDSQHTMALFPGGVREYEIVGENYTTIRLTLFRTYGWMGKEDLRYRPGRASGEKVIATQAAELNSNLEFSFGLYINNNNFDNSSVGMHAKNYHTAIQVYEYADFLNGRLIFSMDEEPRELPSIDSLISTEGYLILSTLKKAKNRSGYIMRLYNAQQKTNLTDRITFKYKPTRVELVDLKEDTIAQLSLIDNQCLLDNIGHAKYINVYFE